VALARGFVAGAGKSLEHFRPVSGELVDRLTDSRADSIRRTTKLMYLGTIEQEETPRNSDISL
jgi:hypothetical protein